MNALATAIANALARATRAGSVDAKRREGKGPHRTGPNGVFREWSPFPSILTEGDGERAQRFWAKVQFAPGDSCWEWMAEKNHRGYGRFTFKGFRTVAHRVAHELAIGPIPDGLQVGHLCHNPGCVKPAHLEAMTAARNIAQRDERLGRTPGKPLTRQERNRRYNDRQRQRRQQQRIDSGWWVQI